MVDHISQNIEKLTVKQDEFTMDGKEQNSLASMPNENIMKFIENSINTMSAIFNAINSKDFFTAFNEISKLTNKKKIVEKKKKFVCRITRGSYNAAFEEEEKEKLSYFWSTKNIEEEEMKYEEDAKDEKLINFLESLDDVVNELQKPKDQQAKKIVGKCLLLRQVSSKKIKLEYFGISK